MMGDKVIVRTAVEEIKPTRVKMVYKILRQKDYQLLGEGFASHAFMSKEGKPLNIRGSHPFIWDKLTGGLDLTKN